MRSVRSIGHSIRGVLAAVLLASLALSGLHAHADSRAASSCVVCVASHAPADLPAVSALGADLPCYTQPLNDPPRLAPPVSPAGVARGRAPPLPLA